jgi:hypothetical protein
VFGSTDLTRPPSATPASGSTVTRAILLSTGHLEGSVRRGRGCWWVECGTCQCGWQVLGFAEERVG